MVVRCWLLLVAVVVLGCASANGPSASGLGQPSATDPYAGLPSNACGGFHLKIVNDRSDAAHVTINGSYSVDVAAGETRTLVQSFDVHQATPWEVVVKDATSNEQVYSATMLGPVDQKVTLTDTVETQAPYSLTLEGC